MKWVLVLISWVGSKVNGLDLGSELSSNKVNEFEVSFGHNRLGWA